MARRWNKIDIQLLLCHWPNMDILKRLLNKSESSIWGMAYKLSRTSPEMKGRILLRKQIKLNWMQEVDKGVAVYQLKMDRRKDDQLRTPR